MAGPSISRIKKNNFFGPQYVSHWSLWTSRKPNDTQTPALHICLLVSYVPLGSVLGTDFSLSGLQHSFPEQFAGAARVFHTLGSVIQIRKPPRIRASKQASSAALQHCTCAARLRRDDACPCTSTTAPARRARRKKWRTTRTPSRRTSTSASATTVASGVLALDESRRWRGGA